MKIAYFSGLASEEGFSADIDELELSVEYVNEPNSEVDFKLDAESSSFGYFVKDFLENGANCFFRSVAHLSERSQAHLHLSQFLQH